jgi:hypothetical protein
MLAIPGNTNKEACGTSGNLPSPQALKIPLVSSSFQHIKNGSFYSESSSELDNQSLLQRTIASFPCEFYLFIFLVLVFELRAS